MIIFCDTVSLMKNVRDALLRAVVATIIYGIFTNPVLDHLLIKVGNNSEWYHLSRVWLDYLAFFVPVFIGMVIYNFIATRPHKEH